MDIDLKNRMEIAHQKLRETSEALSAAVQIFNKREYIEQFYPSWCQLPEVYDDVELTDGSTIVGIGRVLSVDKDKRIAVIRFVNLDADGNERGDYAQLDKTAKRIAQERIQEAESNFRLVAPLYNLPGDQIIASL